MFDVRLRGFRCVVRGVVGVSVRDVGVVSSLLVVSGVVMLRGFLMVSRRMLVMLSSLLRHDRSSFFWVKDMAVQCSCRQNMISSLRRAQKSAGR
jgi:hypothetical protein